MTATPRDADSKFLHAAGLESSDVEAAGRSAAEDVVGEDAKGGEPRLERLLVSDDLAAVVEVYRDELRQRPERRDIARHQRAVVQVDGADAR